MSRNFELLRQASWGQEFFQGLPPEPTPAEAARKQIKRPPAGNDQVSTFVRRTFLHPRSHVRSVMFVGISERAGSTWTCAQAARVLAEAIDDDVCAVDANLKAPSLHQQFSREAEAGLSEAALGSTPVG